MSIAKMMTNLLHIESQMPLFMIMRLAQVKTRMAINGSRFSDLNQKKKKVVVSLGRVKNLSKKRSR